MATEEEKSMQKLHLLKDGGGRSSEKMEIFLDIQYPNT